MPAKPTKEDAKGFEDAPEAVRGKPPVIIWGRVNPEIEDRAYHYHSIGLEYPVDLLEGGMGKFDMLQGVQGNDGSHRPGREIDQVEVEHFVHTGAVPHVAPHVCLAGEERPQVGRGFKT